MRGLGWPELVIILVIVVLLFGATRLPIIARSIGSSAREFRKGMADGAGTGDDDELSDVDS
ncbi:MAG: twin-arginine translocase TatA/TatE family subunit [Acidimicrobiia bacterium]|nr:twin-arginine translocase TatA/TatE family subunit [Acidimicrobiia bacterium]